MDDILPPRRLPRGRHGPLHGSLLLGEGFCIKESKFEFYFVNTKPQVSGRASESALKNKLIA